MIRKRRGVALGWCRFGTSYRQPDRLPERQLIHPAAVPIWKGRQQAGRQTDSHSQHRPWPGTEDLLRTDNHVLVAHERWYVYPSVPGGRRRLVSGCPSIPRRGRTLLRCVALAVAGVSVSAAREGVRSVWCRRLRMRRRPATASSSMEIQITKQQSLSTWHVDGTSTQTRHVQSPMPARR